MGGMSQQANAGATQTYVINPPIVIQSNANQMQQQQPGQQPQQIVINQANLQPNPQMKMAAANPSNIRPGLSMTTNSNLINSQMNQVVINASQLQQQQQQPQQQQLLNNPNAGMSSQYISTPQQQQPGIAQAPQASQPNAAEDELYNRKIEELKQHLPRLQKMYQNASG